MTPFLGDGNWGIWSAQYSGCSVTCGDGEKWKTRSCDSPPPDSSGMACLLSDGSGKRGTEEWDKRIKCSLEKCPSKRNLLVHR